MKKSILWISYLIIGLILFACKDNEDITPNNSEEETEQPKDEDNQNPDKNDDTPQISVQQRLDNEETPFEIYTSDNSLLDSLYGKNYVGGLIAYLNTSTGSGFVASTEDVDTAMTIWGCSNSTILEQFVAYYDISNGLPVYGYIALATDEEIGFGKSNTETIIDKCTVSGALFCTSYSVGDYADWYMPNKNEMIEVSKALADLNTLTTNYWTSTQENKTSNAKVYVINTDDHSASLHGKSDAEGLGLRAIRNF